MRPGRPQLQLDRIQAVVFDADGVLVDTVRVHARAWKRAFDEFLRRRARHTGESQEPFAIREDYLRFVDGRSGLDGARAFLRSRGISLPEGLAHDPDSVPEKDVRGPAEGGKDDLDTLGGLAARKASYFLDEISRSGVVAFPSSVALLRDLRRRGAGIAVVSAGRSCARVLEAAHLDEMTDVRVDGNDAARLRLPGKPDPATFLEACRRLHAAPEATAVVDDTPVGIEAAARGGFGLIIGVDRAGAREAEQRKAGAHVVVRDLGEIEPKGRRRTTVDTCP